MGFFEGLTLAIGIGLTYAGTKALLAVFWYKLNPEGEEPLEWYHCLHFVAWGFIALTVSSYLGA